MIFLPAALAGDRLRELRIEAGNGHLGVEHERNLRKDSR